MTVSLIVTPAITPDCAASGGAGSRLSSLAVSTAAGCGSPLRASCEGMPESVGLLFVVTWLILPFAAVVRLPSIWSLARHLRLWRRALPRNRIDL